MRQAQLDGLQYLSEAEITRVTMDTLPEEARQVLESIGNIVDREQYLDFLRLGRFRQSLLCRDTVGIQRENLHERLTSMYIASPLQPSGEVEINSDANARFVSQTGPAVTVNQPFVKAVV